MSEDKAPETNIPKLSDDEKEIEQKMLKVISQMPDSVKPRFQVLHMLSDERSKINDEFEKEIKAMEAKYNEKKKPLLEARAAILKGTNTEYAEFLEVFDATAVKLETIVAGIVKTDEEKEQDDEDKKEHTPVDVTYLKEVQGVPDFWEKAIRGNQMVMQSVTEKDEPILKHITDVQAEETLEPKQVRVDFYFSENEFFTNDKLSLTVHLKDSDEVTEVEGTFIDWKDGKDVTKKKIKKKQKHKKTNEVRTIVKTVPSESMFNAFEPRKMPEDMVGEDDDSETEKLIEQIDISHDMAREMCDMYMNDALEYYLGFGQDLSDLMGGQFPGGAYGDEDDEDDDDDEDDKKKPKKKAAKKSGDAAEGAVGPDGKQQECKQQ